jgi:hypothetical protein
MSNKLTFGFVFVAATAMLAACRTAPSLPVWDYRILESYTVNLERQLNVLGAEGWTVVSSSTVGSPPAEAPRVAVILKRPRS